MLFSPLPRPLVSTTHQAAAVPQYTDCANIKNHAQLAILTPHLPAEGMLLAVCFAVRLLGYQTKTSTAAITATPLSTCIYIWRYVNPYVDCMLPTLVKRCYPYQASAMLGLTNL